MKFAHRIALSGSLLLSTFIPLQAQYGDCATAFRLCANNQAYTFPAMLDGGKVEEIPQAECHPEGIPEQHAVWLELEVAKGGHLSFDITPLHAGDDLDFVVYSIQGPGCGQQKIIRCAATGSEYGEERVDVCVGTTGLRQGERDAWEGAGCRSESNGYLEALTLVTGQRYLIQVLNYHGAHGFELRLNGNAELRREYALWQDEGGTMKDQLLANSTESINAWGTPLTYQESIGGCVLYLDRNEKKDPTGFKMEVFPNPATTALNIKLVQEANQALVMGQPSQGYWISIYDAKGLIVDQLRHTSLGLPVEKVVYPIEHLPAGIYLVKCQASNHPNFQVLTFSKQ